SYTGVQGEVASGRAGGAWTGNGIVTDQASGNRTTLAVAEASQVLGSSGGLFGTESVDGTTVLVKYTYGGDANLDGKIDISDYGRIDFNIPLGVNGWYNGDYNYDGKIDMSDYGIIDFNIGIQGPPIPSAPGNETAVVTD